MIYKRDRIMFGNSFKFVIFDMRQQLSRKLDRANTWIQKPILAKYQTYFVIQKSHIERRIVRYQHRVTEKLEQIVGNVREQRRIFHHLIVDAGERGYESRD